MKASGSFETFFYIQFWCLLPFFLPTMFRTWCWKTDTLVSWKEVVAVVDIGLGQCCLLPRL